MNDRVMDFGVIIARTKIVNGEVNGKEGTHHVFTSSEGKDYKSHWGLMGIKTLMERDGYMFFHQREQDRNVH